MKRRSIIVRHYWRLLRWYWGKKGNLRRMWRYELKLAWCKQEFVDQMDRQIFEALGGD